MERFGSISLAVTVAFAVAMVGVTLNVVAGFSRVEAGLTVACVMLGAAQLVNLLVRDRSEIDVDGIRESVAELSMSLDTLRRDSEMLHRRLDAAEEQHQHPADTAGSGALDQQMKTLEALVGRLADNLGRDAAAAGPVAGPSEAPPDAPERDGTADALAGSEHSETAMSVADAAAADAEILAAVRHALETNRIDLYLQPIVSLPQRRTRFYEGFTRLRGAGGEIILPSAYVRVAERAGVMPDVDYHLLTGCVRVVRRMAERNRELGVFCNISAQSLLDAAFFPRLLEFMGRNTDLAQSLYFELSQQAVEAFGPLELESLSALRHLGFGFSLDQVVRLDLDAETLANRGFRFVKIDSATLLHNAREAGARIHGADLSELLRRFGIEMIVEKIERERTVVDLLDYDVRYGQGYLFSAPRPVRGDILEQEPLRRTGTA